MKQAKIIMTAKLLTEQEIPILPETPVHLGEVLTVVRELRGRTSEGRYSIKVGLLLVQQ